MKKLLIFGLTICFFITTFFNGFSQKERIGSWLNKKVSEKSIQYEPAYPYSLTVSYRDYTSLENPVSLSDSIIWDDPQYRILVGFNFEFMGLTVDTLIVGDNYVGFDFQLIYDEEWDQYYYDISAGVEVFGADMIDYGYGRDYAWSHINYKLEGTEGNHILKVEWKLAAFYNEYMEIGETESYISYQLWLYEADNHFEIRFGPSNMTNEAVCYDGNPGPYIDFGREINYETIHGYYLDGNPSNPIMLPLGLSFDQTVDGTPSYGTTYFFTVGEGTTIGISEKQLEKEVEIFPNPTSGIFTIQSEKTRPVKVQVYDILGNRVFEEIVENNAKIDISSVPKGTYIVTILSKNAVISTQKLIKN